MLKRRGWRILFTVSLILLCSSCPRRKSADAEYFFDNEGRLKWYAVPGAGRTDLSYDARGLLASARSATEQARFGYDAHGNLIWSKDGAGSTQFFYDAFDRLCAEVSRHSPPWMTAYDYDSQGRVRRVELIELERLENDAEFGAAAQRIGDGDFEGVTDWGTREREALRMVGALRARPEQERRQWTPYDVQYHYDISNRITSIDSDWGTVRYSYQADGRKAERTLPNGVQTIYEFRADGYLTTLRHLSASGDLLAEFRYSYNAAGEVVDAETTPPGLAPAAPLDKPAASPWRRESPFIEAGGSPVFYLHGDGLLADRSGSGQVRFFLEDGFGQPVRATDGDGRLTAVPARLPGTHDGRGAAAGTGVDVFVGGIFTSPSDLARIRRERGVETISTSAVGRGFGSSLWGYVADLVRAPANYLGIPGGATRLLSDLRAIQDQHPGEPITLDGHSNGVLTIYKVREALVKDIKSGRLNIAEVRTAGAGLADALRQYFVQNGVSVSVTEVSPENRLRDIVGFVSTPDAELGRRLHSPARVLDFAAGTLAKAVALAVWATEPLIPGERIGTAHHDLDRYYSGLFPPVQSATGLRFETDPKQAIDRELGGINLSAAGEFSGDMGSIAGAVYDPKKQWMVLLSEPGATGAATPADFAVALALARSHQEASFSLDPADPKNPEGPWLKAVYRPENILAGTQFGQTLFEADWLLKQYSFNVVAGEDGHWSERRSRVPGLKGLPELTFESDAPISKEGQWTRAWIEVKDEKVPVAVEGGVVRVSKPDMIIESRRQIVDPSSETGLRDVPDVSDPIQKQFKETFTRLYDQISAESPEFGRVRELVKAIVLAKWMVKENIPVDEAWLAAAQRIPTVAKAHALDVSWQRQSQKPFVEGNRRGTITTTRICKLFGGVNAHVEPAYEAGGGEARSLRDAVLARTEGSKPETTFGIDQEGKTYSATVMPFTPAGREVWREAPVIERDGSRYQLANVNGIRRVKGKTDGRGNTTEYGYDASGALDRVAISSRNGDRATYQKERGGGTWTLTSARGNVVQLVYDTDGSLRTVEADGTTVASYQYDAPRNTVQVRRGGDLETYVADAGRNLREYRVRNESVPGTEESLQISYTDDGRIAGVSGSGVTAVKIAYAPGSVGPASITSPMGVRSFSYDQKGRLESMLDSSGARTTYSYDGDLLRRVGVRLLGASSDYEFDKNGPTVSRDLLGRVTRRTYSQAGLPETERDDDVLTTFGRGRPGDVETLRRSDGSGVVIERSRDGEEVRVQKPETQLPPLDPRFMSIGMPRYLPPDI
jgi:YD repeat-containing protein